MGISCGILELTAWVPLPDLLQAIGFRTLPHATMSFATFQLPHSRRPSAGTGIGQDIRRFCTWPTRWQNKSPSPCKGGRVHAVESCPGITKYARDTKPSPSQSMVLPVGVLRWCPIQQSDLMSLPGDGQPHIRRQFCSPESTRSDSTCRCTSPRSPGRFPRRPVWRIATE